MSSPEDQPEKSQSHTAVGLFAGIGGIELGLQRAGFEGELLCELDPAASAVLEERFPDVPRHADVTTLTDIPAADVLAAGFPCQDLSQAGRTEGIQGRQSRLVEHVFRLFDSATKPPKWLLLENVPFMLRLDRGRAMSYLTGELDARGFVWAYRVVDTRAFGLPQRRKRVVLLASRETDPRSLLFGEDAGEPKVLDRGDRACGFYWTEGLRGLGWAVDAIPTLKGGSSIGIPSPPAIWMPDGSIVTPALQDAERLQGFAPDWTEPARHIARGARQRWKLVGNAVSVPVFEWVGERLRSDDTANPWTERERPAANDRPWPNAAWGREGSTWDVDVSDWPRQVEAESLADFLDYEPVPLSERATAGFLKRAGRSKLRFPNGFLDAMSEHLDRVRLPIAA